MKENQNNLENAPGMSHRIIEFEDKAIKELKILFVIMKDNPI
jgi:hypothetical protein|tara:strand:+ start:81 stop:206 length:126 start_codon:yes stop_codon:yes gene_type:complete